MFVYPHAGSVSPAGGLAIPFWPRDPWTGRRLTPGATQGHYAYVRSPEGRGYVLTAYLSGARTFVVKGRMGHTPMLAYDHRGKEGLNLLFQYVKTWSRDHDGRLPTAEMVSREGAVGRQQRDLVWPSNPWDHRAMEQRADRGSFSYARSADGETFTLSLHQALKEDYVLQGTREAKKTAGDGQRETEPSPADAAAATSRLDVFTEDGIEDIHLATLEVLERTGVWVELDEALDISRTALASSTGSAHRRIPPHVVADAIAGTPPAWCCTTTTRERHLPRARARRLQQLGEGVKGIDPASGELRPSTKEPVRRSSP